MENVYDIKSTKSLRVKLLIFLCMNSQRVNGTGS